ncbi:MAG: CopG family transcriptional regulator [Anaerolineaceae bacterium]
MAKVKTAISIDGDLLEETDTLAVELDIPRSRVVSLALEEFIQRHRNRKLLHQINEAYKDGLDDDDTAVLKIIQSHRRKLTDRDRDEWK